MKIEQISCVGVECGSKRLQLVSVSYNSKETALDLVCMDCGLLLKQRLDVAIPNNDQPTIKKLEGNYYG